jgi:DNA-binding transcriptional ArsR family regulator
MHISSCSVVDCQIHAHRVELAARLFRGLADPTRLAILLALNHGPLRVVDLCRKTGRAQPNVSAHLGILRDCGIVTGEVRGRETVYSVDHDSMAHVLFAAERVVQKMGPKLCESAWCSRSNCGTPLAESV